MKWGPLIPQPLRRRLLVNADLAEILEVIAARMHLGENTPNILSHLIPLPRLKPGGFGAKHVAEVRVRRE
jgi:hypothetical protein